jgi:hypothetical protein
VSRHEDIYREGDLGVSTSANKFVCSQLLGDFSLSPHFLLFQANNLETAVERDRSAQACRSLLRPQTYLPGCQNL